MSGIFGFFCRNPKEGLSEKYIHVLEMWNRMYGTDESDFFYTDGYGVGCHIEHLSVEHPMSKPVIRDGENLAVIDAVLYNRDEIFESLNVQKSSVVSDEELLYEMIKKQGYDSLAGVNGDFAGAVYNENKKTWMLFRDHMGVRPLFYYIDDTVFAFSTDRRGLLAMPGADLRINDNQFYIQMMGYNDLSLCETEFYRIHCIRPASYRIIESTFNGFSEKEIIFWKLRQKKIRMKTDEDYFEELRRLVTDSIKCRMDAVSGIIGAELSGGLDSSVISILINRLGREAKYFSWSLSPEENPLQKGDDERKVIMDICNQEHITCEFTSRQSHWTMNDSLQEIMPSYINTQSLSTGASWLKNQGAKVVFTGHGGDEGVSHRSNPFELWYHGEYFSFIKYFWNSTKGQKLRLLRTVKRVINQIRIENPNLTQIYENKTVNGRIFLNKEFKERMDGTIELQPLYFAYDPAAYIEQGGSRPRLDNVAYHGAKNGIRYMVPFLDYRVIDFAVSIPRKLYLNKGMNRYIYRQAFRDIMPESLYKVNYKDPASQRGIKPQKGERDAILKQISKITSRLDREFWKDYLDFNEVDRFTLAENFTPIDYMKVIFTLNYLNMCCFLQNEKDNAAKWCEEHE